MPAKTKRPMRASLYVRLSKAAAETNVSKDGMIADLRALCERDGFEEVALHVDNGLSGAVRDRPEFLAWLADAREGRADVLATWHADRLTREGLNVAALILDVVEGKDSTSGKVTSTPVRLVDTRGLDSAGSDSWRMTFVVLAEVARAERSRMVDRNRAAARRLRTAGRWPGGPAPYGYAVTANPNGPGKVLAIDPAEAAVVREAADLILRQGESLLRVSRHLNGQGYAPRRAREWTSQAVRSVLTGDAVLGRLKVDGEVLRDEDGHAVAVFEPILSLADALALREALAPRGSATASRGRPASRLLSGALLCEGCGTVLKVDSASAGRRVYRCPSRGWGQVCPAPVTVTCDPVEAWAEDFYLARFGRLPERVRRLEAGEAAEDVAALQERKAAALAALGKDPTPENFSRLQEVQAALEVAEVAAAASSPRLVEVLTGRTNLEAWEAADLDGRRAMLRRDLEAVLPLTIGRGVAGRKGFDPGRVLDLDVDALPTAEDVTL